MTAPPRRDSRRDYRHFPAAYTDLLHRAADAGSTSIGPMTQRDALASLRDLYRFKMFLSSGCDEDPDDAHCRALFNIANSLIMRVEPTATEQGALTHLIVLTLNPIVAAMQQTGS
jgi:hypothetical protein